MSDRGDLERDIAQEDELRALLRAGDDDLRAPAFAAVESRVQRRGWHSFAPAAAVVLVLVAAVGIAGWRAASQVAAPSRAPVPTSTTLVYPGSPCQGVSVRPQRFEDSIAVPPGGGAAPTHPPFGGASFSGVGRVVSIAPDGSSVVLELVKPETFEAYGPTAVKITPQTSFDHTETVWAFVGAGGVAKGATELPLAPGAPAVAQGQRLMLQCTIAGHATAAGGTTARSAPAEAASWALAQPLPLGFPAGALVSYERSVHVAAFADLGLSVGQSVRVEMSGTPGDYRATRLTNVLLTYGSPTANASPMPSATAAAGRELRWSQPAAVPDSGALFDVLPWRDGYVASADATVGGRHAAATFVSQDGLHWERTWAFAGSFGSLVATPARLIAFVRGDPSSSAAEAWTSTDGRTWVKAGVTGLAGGTIGHTAVRDGVLLGVGGDAAGTTRLWRSTDGIAWTPVSMPSPKAIIRSIASVSDGFLVVGREGDPDISSGGVGAYGSGVPMAWWSADGRSWSAVRVEGAAAVGAQLGEVFRVSSGYLAIGSDSVGDPGSPRRGQLWSSADGHDWKLVGPPAHWGLAKSDGQQLVVFGYADAQAGTLGVWYTRDGRTWTDTTYAGDEADVPAFIESPTRNSRVDAIFPTADGVIVAGQRDGQLVVWSVSAR